MISQILFLVILILLNAYFAATEIAFISLNDAKIEKMSKEGNKKAKQITKMLKNPSKFLATIQIGITLAGFLSSAFASDTFADILAPFLTQALPIFSVEVWRGISIVIITIILSFFTLVFGELVPKRLAMKYDEKIAFATIGVIKAISIITAPFVKLLTASTNLVSKIFGVTENEEATITEEEIKMMIDEGEEKTLLLAEKNRALIEKQNYEIYAATLRERNRIAREIHDTLGHTMTGLSAGIDACIALIDYSVDETKKQLNIISGVARQGLKDVRRSMKKLRPDTLERESLESAIEKLITEMMSTSKVSIEFQSFLPSLVFEDDEEDTIYRIVQEGITNAIRHGHASRIFINFKKVDIWLVIRIRDNGIGCKDIHKGFGLTHMKERVDMLHGTVTYSSNNGFQVVAKLPIRWRNEER